MAMLRLFAAAREAAGVARVDLDGATVADVLDQARARYGARFSAVVAVSRVWVNGQPAEGSTTVGTHDVVAVLPPVSGGSGPEAGGALATRLPPRPGGDRRAWPAAPRRPAVPAGASRDDRFTRFLSQPAPVEAPVGAVSGLRPTSPAPFRAALPTPMSSLAPAIRPVGPATSGPATLAPVPVAPVTVAPVPTPASDADGSAVAAATALAVVPEMRTARRPRQPLTVVQTSDLPHGRRGALWAAVTVGAVAAGQGWLAVWLGLMAFVAASQTASVWRSRGERPMPLVAAGTAAAVCGAAAFGFRSVTAVIVLAMVLSLVTRLVVQSPAPARDVALTLALGVPLGLAAGSLVLLRSVDVQVPMLLLAYAAVYDAGAYLVGTGASSAWEGPAAGVAALIPLTLLASLVMVPPFKGVAPLLLGLLGAVCAPLGPLAGSALLGDRTGARAPALRRLDSLLVMGPLWAWCAAAFLQG